MRRGRRACRGRSFRSAGTDRLPKKARDLPTSPSSLQASISEPGITDIPVQAMVAEKPAAVAPEQPAFRPERLESLLNSIKQDLNQLVQK